MKVGDEIEAEAFHLHMLFHRMRKVAEIGLSKAAEPGLGDAELASFLRGQLRWFLDETSAVYPITRF